MSPIKNTCSIIIPALQEEGSIGVVVDGLREQLGNFPEIVEIIVVADGCRDTTAEIARDHGAMVIEHPHNKGYGASLKTGIRQAKGEWVLFFDADGQHDPSDIYKFIASFNDFDMLVGSRPQGGGSPLWRRPGKAMLQFVANNLCGRPIPDINSGFRAIRKNLALKIMPLMPNGFSFSTTSTVAAFRGGYSIAYLPINIRKRAAGVSSVRISDGIKAILLVIRLTVLFSPLRIFLPISFLVFLLGSTLTLHSYLAYSQSSLKGLITLLASLHFFLFGVLLDQVSAIRRGEVIK